ncbi:MAG: hypothetical protein Q8K58_01495 [Acidimicrobiales bacterium]|nr:hypothetical protein [Acidimicrobiales bacterium]
MAALWLLARRTLRANRRAMFGLALVLALTGGVGLTSMAAARRTASAFPRYLEASNASDVALNPVVFAEDAGPEVVAPVVERARSLDGVAHAATHFGLEKMYLLAEDGVAFADLGGEVVGSLDGRYTETDRATLVEGRLPDPDAPDEAFVNTIGAELGGLEVGSELEFGIFEIGEGDPRDFPRVGEATMHVVGIGQFAEEALADDFDRSPRILLSEAATRDLADVAGGYIWQALTLAPGARVEDVLDGYQALLPEDVAVNVRRNDEQLEGVQRGIRPIVATLGIFGGFAAAAALVLGALGAARLLAAASPDVPTLRSVGFAPGRAAMGLAAPAIAAVMLGAVGAVALAIALSPVGPVGPVRAFEPDRGLDIDVTVLGLGALVLGLVLGAFVLAMSRFTLRRQQAGAGARPSRSRLVQGLAGMGLGPVATVGAAHAAGSGAGGRTVPSRATLAACVLSITAIISALTFGAGVRQLLREPDRYGWAADLVVEFGGGYEEIITEGGPAVVEAADGRIAALMVTGNGRITVDGSSVSTMGIEPVSGPPPVTVVDGRLPRASDEIAFGRVTAGELGVGLGDEVTTRLGELRVVGMVALPAIGPLASSHPSLGQGALVTYDTLAELDDAAFRGTAMVRLAEGVDAGRFAPSVVEMVAAEMTYGLPAMAGSIYTEQRPAEVAALSPARGTAHLLAGLLALAAVIALATTLSASVRRQARTYAVLSALGFRRGEVRRTVRWQTNLLLAGAVVIGVPLGIAVGRWTWLAFAGQLGAATTPSVPLGLIALALVALVAVANVVGEPATRAAGGHAGRARILQVR